ncbi:hypothetical protein PT974_01560 [Cladobotryum mycophilum]|uniref:Heparan-alpha-glucosaminide N-acetyltransferase catalytic domain-containing protein n=1 Tax=Cladobotryum mycophilum TaxID=491253 RepID=A0ABR0T562_9HYPO
MTGTPEARLVMQPPAPTESYNDTLQDSQLGAPSTGNNRRHDTPAAHDSTYIQRSATQPSDPPTPPKAPRVRILAPDLLRGVLMLVMTLDHVGSGLGTWRSGTEWDGTVVNDFTAPLAYAIRTMAHNIISGFMFLMGMGIIFLGQSRKKLGWPPMRCVRYFFIRGMVIIIVPALVGVALPWGPDFYVNLVLSAQGVNFFLLGLLWLLFEKTEKMLAQQLARLKICSNCSDSERENEPLLARERVGGPQLASDMADLSWHIHNAVLVILGVITISWNIWFAQHHGCLESISATIADHQRAADLTSTSPNFLFRILFWPVETYRWKARFPALSWSSFAILGFLYGRITVSRRWSPRAMAAGQALVASLFAFLFILTRVLQVGNLSEGCLRTPSHERHPKKNPYLVSPEAFFYVIKYPPDVAFWALTMAGNNFLLAVFGATPLHMAKRLTILLDIGSTPLFFYIGSAVVWFAFAKTLMAIPGHPHWSMSVCFVISALIVLIMWPLCRAYGRFKNSKPADSIWRLF